MKCISLYIIGFSLAANGQHSIYAELGNAASISMGRTTVCDWDPSFASSNPAQLGFIKQPDYSTFIKNQYSLKALNTFGIRAQWPMTHNDGWSAGLAFDGGANYNESLAQLYYGRKIGSTSSIGIGLNGLIVRMNENVPVIYLNTSCGLQSIITENWMLGFVFHNPLNLLRSSSFKIPFYAACGFNYRIYTNLQSRFEIQKEGFSPMAAGFGLSYGAMEYLMLLFGIHTTGPKFSCGARYKINTIFKIEMGLEYHFILGFSPAFGIHWTKA